MFLLFVKDKNFESNSIAGETTVDTLASLTCSRHLRRAKLASAHLVFFLRYLEHVSLA